MCTNIYFNSRSNHWFFGRTQEYADDTPVCGITIARDSSITFSNTVYQSRVACGGVNFDGSAMGEEIVMLLDGINEHGLAGATLAFPKYLCKYQSKDSILASNRLVLCAEEVVTWVLSNYASIQEIKDTLNNDVAVCIEPNRLGMNLYQHYMFSDDTGKCIVVEPTLDGAFEIHDNPIGVMTNQPEFPWHLTNLQNYIELNNRIPHGRKLSNIEIPAALGTGLLGLPGDTTPQSRFIRATTFVNLMERPVDFEAVNAGFHVLNNFDIPKGVVINSEGKVQYTQYTSMYDIKNTTGYLKRYETMTITPFKMDFTNCKGIQYLKI